LGLSKATEVLQQAKMTLTSELRVEKERQRALEAELERKKAAVESEIASQRVAAEAEKKRLVESGAKEAARLKADAVEELRKERMLLQSEKARLAAERDSLAQQKAEAKSGYAQAKTEVTALHEWLPQILFALLVGFLVYFVVFGSWQSVTYDQVAKGYGCNAETALTLATLPSALKRRREELLAMLQKASLEKNPAMRRTYVAKVQQSGVSRFHPGPLVQVYSSYDGKLAPTHGSEEYTANAFTIGQSIAVKQATVILGKLPAGIRPVPAKKLFCCGAVLFEPRRTNNAPCTCLVCFRTSAACTCAAQIKHRAS
jgi:hypothetical protein